MKGYLLSAGTLDYFELPHIIRDREGLILFLEEKNLSPSEYQRQTLHFKDFLPEVSVQDFPTRDQKVILPYLILLESDKHKSITHEELKSKIREDLFGDQFNFYVYLITLYHSGMRPHEALVLRNSDVELDKRKNHHCS